MSDVDKVPLEIPPDAILVAVDKEGNITVDGEVVQFRDVEAAVERAQARRRERGE
jgi:biopolymer transport protein ExbD